MTIQETLTGSDLERQGVRVAEVGSTAGRFDYAADEDYFLFYPEPDHQYRVMVDSSVDTSLGAHDDVSGALVTEPSDDDGPGLNPELSFVAPPVPGAVLFQVDAVGNGERGDENPEAILAPYRVLVFDLGERPDAPERDPAEDLVGDGPETGAALGVGRSIEERIEFAGDIDLFRVYLERGTGYGIAAEGAEGLDPYLQLLTPRGEVVAEDDDDGEGDDAAIALPIEQSGFYFVSVSNADLEAGTGAYTLRLVELGAAALPGSEDVVGQTPGTAPQAEIHETLSSAVESEGDLDTFRYTLSEGVTYRFEARPREADTLDPAVVLATAEGTALAGDDDSGGGVSAALAFTPEATGDYFLTVGGFQGQSTGEYDLAATVAGGAPATTLQAQEIAYLYESALDRDGALEDDLEGLNFWIDERAKFSIEEIAQRFLDSAEFEQKFGAPETLSDGEIVELLYQNFLDRPSDQEGFEFWVDELSRPDFTRPEAFLAFARSTENVAQSRELIDSLVPVGDGSWDFMTEEAMTGA